MTQPDDPDTPEREPRDPDGVASVDDEWGPPVRRPGFGDDAANADKAQDPIAEEERGLPVEPEPLGEQVTERGVEETRAVYAENGDEGCVDSNGSGNRDTEDYRQSEVEEKPVEKFAPDPDAGWAGTAKHVPDSASTDLEAAVGFERSRNVPRYGDDDDGGRPPIRLTRRMIFAVAGVVVFLALIVMLVIGRWNAANYYLRCGETITAEQGRSFPPWGSSKLSGKQWSAIRLGEDTECDDSDFGTKAELEAVFLKALIDQATLFTRQRHAGQAPTTEAIQEAEKQLKQAILLARRDEFRDQRRIIARLQGDVQYWRAQAGLAALAAELDQIHKWFAEAEHRRPQHTTDSAAWAAFVQSLRGELALGPPELRPSEAPRIDGGITAAPPTPQSIDAGAPPPPRLDASPGVALPMEADATPQPPDASLPRGGVLL